MTKTSVSHVDVLGQELRVDDFVAYPSSSGLGRNALKIGKVVALTPKMIKVVNLTRRISDWNKVEAKVTTRYPDDCVKLDDKLITFYILKNDIKD